MAVLLYAGIMTDTGSFRYENTSAHSHAVAEKLMAFDISASQMLPPLCRNTGDGHEALYGDNPQGPIA